ncbi:hypothetical protein ACFYYM_31770 [Streptomyces erythrochromogenes]|uniref:hypothetical protein n=1 Tax=Streptomyces erythrochromogenes TaxID=285574 RepID=UPI0036835ABC
MSLTALRDRALISLPDEPKALDDAAAGWLREGRLSPALGLHRLPARVVQEEAPLQVPVHGGPRHPEEVCDLQAVLSRASWSCGERLPRLVDGGGAGVRINRVA